MALTGPEKAMYNFLIKREAAGNLNATQATQLAALKAKVGLLATVRKELLNSAHELTEHLSAG